MRELEHEGVDDVRIDVGLLIENVVERVAVAIRSEVFVVRLIGLPPFRPECDLDIVVATPWFER